MVESVQEYLVEFNLFAGPADGRLTADTRRAIRAYQKQSNLSVDGLANENLLEHMERVGRAEALNRKLTEARNSQIEQARHALASNPATRDLLESGKPNVAKTNTGAPRECLRAVTTECLVIEALQAARVITRDDYRDWALRDVIRAFARAGRMEDARATIKLLTDLRLVLVSLRETAIALVKAGQIDEASALAATIPDNWNRARALLAIAQNEGSPFKAFEALLKLLPRLEDRAASAEIAGELAVALARRNERARAERAIAAVADYVNGPAPDAMALGAIATAYTKIDDPAKAVRLLARIGDSGRDHTALAQAAGLMARAGNLAEALATADRIRTPQLHALALTNIAAAQRQNGRPDEARPTLRRAAIVSLDIERPFAADSARARIAAVWASLGENETAFATLASIKSRALRARTVWRITIAAPAPEGPKLMPRAFAATARIESAFDRAATLARAAGDFAAANRPDDAQTLFRHAIIEARTIRNNWWRARILSLLAQVLAAL